MPPVKIQPPTGTRDLYPLEAAKRRFITEAWRKVSINHGFEEIDGPTFEHLELYTVKSGEGIVNELFSFTRAGGEKDYALRPEFTPTLARMYAARANSLPKPTKWFSVGPYFRAERPQRGRSREFLQWNCDVIGLATSEKPTSADILRAKSDADAELVGCVIGLLRALRLGPKDAQVRISDRLLIADVLNEIDVPKNRHDAALAVLDKRSKLEPAEAVRFAESVGLSATFLARFDEVIHKYEDFDAVRGTLGEQVDRAMGMRSVLALHDALQTMGFSEWIDVDYSIVRGLAYYTGMVFEVIVDGERAVAGGGRYDNLIELFGGPPTPAVGFGMGDVVLSLVLQDKGLMPSDAELLEKAGLRPDVFVIADAGRDASDDQRAAIENQLRPTVAALRSAGLHARHSYKSTKNIGKLLEEASRLRARFAVIIDSPQSAKIKDLTTNTQDQSPTSLIDLPTTLKSRLRTG